MKTTKTENNTFQNLRQWLYASEKSTAANVDGVICRLRKLEENLNNSYVKGTKVGLLHPLYERLSKATIEFSAKARKSEIKKVINVIQQAYSILNGKKQPFDKCNNGEISKFKSALNAYVYFLECMFKEFTYVVADGDVVVPKRNRVEISGFQKLPSEFFKKGIVELFRKSKIFLSSDSDKITLTLDALTELLDDYATLHGAEVKIDIYRLTSFMVIGNSVSSLDWKIVLANSILRGSCIDDIIYPEPISICYNPLSSQLELYREKYCYHVIELPSFAIQDSIDNKLSVRVMQQPPIERQIELINKLRQDCRALGEILRPYIKLRKNRCSERVYMDNLYGVCSSIDWQALVYHIGSSYETLQEYGKGFRIELVTE